MDIQIKELIAIGASVTANCQPCLKYHLNKARESGADNRQINKAVEVGKMVRKGAACEMDVLISDQISVDSSPGCAEVSECGDGCRS